MSPLHPPHVTSRVAGVTKTLRFGSGGVHDARPTALEHDRGMEGNGSIVTRVERLVPELRSDLERLARIPSIAFPSAGWTP